MVQNQFSIFPNDAKLVFDRSYLGELNVAFKGRRRINSPLCEKKSLILLCFFIFLDWILGLLSHLGCASLLLFIILFLLLLSSASSFQCSSPSSKFLIFF